MDDVLIIGAGVAGAMVARELSFYQLRVRILEKDADVANETTMANSAIIHAGYDALYGSNKGKFNAKGNLLFDELCQELDVPFRRMPSLVLAFDEKEQKLLEELYENGIKNKVPKMSIIDKIEILRREPLVAQNVHSALLAETSGVISPWELAIKACENAMENEAQLELNTKVEDVKKEKDHFVVFTNRGTFRSKVLVNCMGVESDRLQHMLGHPTSFSISPRKGEYYLFDKSAGQLIKSILFQCPSEKGKGVLIAPTVHGNLIVGPNSSYAIDREEKKTTEMGLKEVKERALRAIPDLPFGETIRTFAGLRASSDKKDFILGASPYDENVIQVAGYESPGLASIPQVALYIGQIVRSRFSSVKKKETAIRQNRKHFVFAEASETERREMAKKDHRYGRIICRCEQVTEGEIVDAVKRNAGATTIKGVKKRTRAGAPLYRLTELVLPLLLL